MRRITIRARLRLAAVAVIAAILFAGGFGIFGMKQSDHGLDRSITATSAVLYQQRSDMMHDALRADVLYALKAVAQADQELLNQIKSEAADHGALFRELFAKLVALPLDPHIRAAVDATLPDIDAYVTAGIAITTRAAGGEGLDTNTFDGFMAHFYKLEESLGNTGDLIEKAGNAAGHDTKAMNAQLTNYAFITSGICALLLFGAMWLISTSITGPLDHIKFAINAIADGKLDLDKRTGNAGGSSRDEITAISTSLEVLRQKLVTARGLEDDAARMVTEQTQVVERLSVGLNMLADGNLNGTIADTMPLSYEPLRQNYNKTLDRLTQTLTKVIVAAGLIRDSSYEIGQSSEDLSRRTENAAAALEQTSAAISQLSVSVRAAAVDAGKVEAIVQSAKQGAADSSQVVAGAVDAMNGIEKSSTQISQIIGVIDDIAFQTNLLALNAGVEAARAGDSGKGFAVVASEVRALAQRSSEASKEIKNLISTSSQLVGRGVEAVARAGQALSNMVDRVTEISGLMTDIATGAADQSTSLSEVTSAVTQLDQSAQQNAAMADRSMTASQSLQSEAVSLGNLMAQFQIGTTTASKPDQQGIRRSDSLAA